MAINAEIRERIYATADELLAANEKNEWPTVEEVRQASRAGMAAVVECMRDWRAKQRQSVTSVASLLPVELATIVQNAAAQLWANAQKHAADNVAAQQTALEAERAEMLELSAQQSAAFEAQAVELERLQEEITALKASLLATKQDLETEREAARRAAHEAAAHQRAVEAKYGEQLTETNKALVEVAQLRGELAGIRDAYSQLLATMPIKPIPAKTKDVAKPKPTKLPKPAVKAKQTQKPSKTHARTISDEDMDDFLPPPFWRG